MNIKKLKSSIAVAACTSELTTAVPGEILLLPAGVFQARDGRPLGLPGWKLDEEIASRVIAKAAAASGDFVIDYEHQTLHSEDNGQPAPAAGWFKKLDWRPDGLHAEVHWTAAAKAHIEAGEYRYISPVFEFDRKTGAVLAVQMAALTNYPALDGHSDLAARAAAKFSNQEEEAMDWKKIMAALGLADDTSEEQALAAVAALKAKADSTEAKDSEIAALKNSAGKVDPALYVPIATFEALKSDVVALRAKLTTDDVAALVKQGLTDGKLLPAQKVWATELGASNIAALKGYLDKTPAIAALKGTQTGGTAPAGAGEEGLCDEELAVCRHTGISPEEYKKQKAA